MRSVDDNFDPARASHLANLFHGKDLAGTVGDVAYVDDLRLRREALLDTLGQKVETWRRHGKLDLLQNDAVAAFTLQPGGDHPRIVLVGGDDFIARFQVQAKLDDFERLAGIARDGNLLRITAKSARQPPADSFEAWIEDSPHIVSGIHVLHLQIAHFGI